MKKFISFLIIVVFLIFFVYSQVIAEKSDSLPSIELTCGSVDAIDTPIDRTINYMAELFEEKSDGKIKLKSFPACQLGEPPEMIEQCSVGALDIVWLDISNYGPIIKDYNVFGMGYTFRDQEHLATFLESPMYKEMTEKLRKDKGLLTISSGAHRVPRDVFSKKPITSAEDFVGLKFRVPGLEMYLKTFEGIGAKPVRIDYGEAYMALSQGLAEAIENPLPAGYGMKFHQVAPYILRTGHIRTINTFVINERRFEGLPTEYQEIIYHVAEAGDKYYVSLMEEEIEEVIEKLKAEGAEILPTIDMRPLQEKLVPVAKEMEEKDKWTRGLWQSIQELE